MTTEKVNDIAYPMTVSKSELDYLVYPSVREDMLKANPSFRAIFDKDSRIRNRILIVADGAIAFDDRGFGLSELINKGLLPSAMPWEKLEVVTAHRSSKDTTADIAGFRFDKTPKAPYDRPFTREFYEQVWFFGHENIDSKTGLKTDSERKVLFDFMNEGGGVFATGDHQDLGAGLCSEIPRVKHMRKWLFLGDHIPPELRAPGIADETRIDTLLEGFDPGFQFDDQSDRVPQKIYPRYRVIKAHRGPEPHPLLGYLSSAITVLPDHMHEGECIVPTGLDQKKVKFGEDVYDEFPPLRRKKERLSPDVVAVATSAGGFLTDRKHVGPANPRCYNVIVAYDGDLVDVVKNCKVEQGKSVGRVMVDSSFHHFLNINLNGTGSDDPFKRGFFDSFGRPTRDYFAILRYYRNIMTWLTPSEKRAEYYAALLIAVRYMSPLIEEIQPIKDPTWRDKILAGILTRRAITERFSQAEATQCTLAAISMLPETGRSLLEQFINPWLPPELIEEELTVLFNAEAISAFCLGCVMLEIASHLPVSPDEAGKVLEEMKSNGKQLEDLFAGRNDPSLKLLTDTIKQASEKFR